MEHSGEAGRVTPGRGRGQDTRQPNPRPATTPTTSNTNEAHTIDNGNGHQDNPHLGQQSHPPNRTLLWNTPSRQRPRPRPTTHQQPHNQPRDCGEGHSGEAGGVTPGRGRGTGRGSAPKDVDMTTTWGMCADTSPNNTTYTDVPSPPRKYAHHNPQPV